MKEQAISLLLRFSWREGNGQMCFKWKMRWNASSCLVGEGQFGSGGKNSIHRSTVIQFLLPGTPWTALRQSKGWQRKQSNGSLKQSTDPYFPQSLFPDSDNVFFATGQETGNAVKLFITWLPGNEDKCSNSAIPQQDVLAGAPEDRDYGLVHLHPTLEKGCLSDN